MHWRGPDGGLAPCQHARAAPSAACPVRIRPKMAAALIQQAPTALVFMPPHPPRLAATAGVQSVAMRSLSPGMGLNSAHQRWGRSSDTHRFRAKTASSAHPVCAGSYQNHPADTKKADEAACVSTPKWWMLLRVAQMAQVPCACAAAAHSFHHPTMPRADKAHMPSSAWRRQVVRWRNTA